MTDRRPSKPNPRRDDSPRKPAAGRYVRRDRTKDGTKWTKRTGATTAVHGRFAHVAPRQPADQPTQNPAPTSPVGDEGDVVVHEDGVRIVGPPAAIEDYLDAREIDRRLADPENQRRIPWAEMKARRGL